MGASLKKATAPTPAPAPEPARVSTQTLLLLLPQDILVEILSKLPAKSLVRFRCVSKFFCALLADHGFGVLHRSLSLTLPSRAGILIVIMSPTPRANPLPYSGAYYTINFSEENQRLLHANRLGYLGAEPFLLAGHLRSSSDGLICSSTLDGHVVVCNVSTGCRIYLPRIQSAHMLSTYALLGFDSQSKRYKVLMSGRKRKDEYKHWILTVGVDKSWREINYSSHPFDRNLHYYDNTPNICIDGVIYFYYWPTIESPWDVIDLSFYIVAFEVGSEKYSLIPIPAEVPQLAWFHSIKRFGISYTCDFRQRNFALLQVEGGRLAIAYVCKIGHLYYMDVWTWEKSKECWEKITMPIPEDDESRIICRVEFHAGVLVLLCSNSSQLFILVCNLKSKVWRKFDIDGVKEFITASDFRMYKTMDNVFSIE